MISPDAKQIMKARDYGRSVSYHPPPWFNPVQDLPDLHADVWVLPPANRDARICEHLGDGVFVGYYRGEPFRWSGTEVAFWAFVEPPGDRPLEFTNLIRDAGLL